MNADRVGAWIIFGSLAVWAIAELAVRVLDHQTKKLAEKAERIDEENLDTIARISQHVRLKPAGPLTAELIARGQARTIDTEWAVLNEAGGLDV